MAESDGGRGSDGRDLWTSAAMATITQGDFSVFGFFETREAGRWGEGSSSQNVTPTKLDSSDSHVHLRDSRPIVRDDWWQFRFQSLGSGRAAQPCGRPARLPHDQELQDARPLRHLFIKDGDFFAFYRPWYDSFGSIRNTAAGAQSDVPVLARAASVQDEYFRNDLHEYYAQLNFTDNFSARIGKQQVIWSEADALSGTEVTNSINAPMHGVYGAERQKMSAPTSA